MKLKRVLVGAEPELQAWNGAHWVRWLDAAPPDDDQRQSPRADSLAQLLAILQLDASSLAESQSRLADLPAAEQGRRLAPFEPLSFRDFMLYERHFIQASRGYLRRFHPFAARVARAFEVVTRRPLASFRPSAVWYRQPIYYLGNHLSFVTEGDELPWPSYTDALDYELELGFLLAKPLLNATPAEALDAIGGFVVFNDLSARDVQLAEMRSGLGPQKAKHFSSAIGAEIVTADEILDRWDALTASVEINGSIVARCSSRGPQFSLGEALAHASRDEPLRPGEFFATGTWPNGSGMENGQWLKPGDTLSLSIDGVGTLTNTVGAR